MENKDYLDPAQVASIIGTEGRRHTLVIRYDKQDGTLRRMVCRYFPCGNVRVVWDMEKGAPRTINLDRVHSIKVLKRGHTDAQAEQKPHTWAEARDNMHLMF